MKILVLSSAFERPLYNARLRSQCDYLIQQGHYVEVYTEPWDALMFEHEYTINELGEKNTSYFKWLVRSVYAMFTNYKERKFAYLVLWHSRKTKFDVVYCSTNSCFPLGAAALVAKIKHIPLHVDLWDMQELNPTYARVTWWHLLKSIRQHLYAHRRNAALAQAQLITTVSPSHVQLIRPINDKVELIYNGFDPNCFNYQPTPTDVFRIAFFGVAFASQNINMLLHIIDKFGNELSKAQWMFYSNDLSYNHIKYATPNIYGILPPEVLPHALSQASLVLLLNDTEDNGLNTEQFYQALGAERPVLFTNVPTGTVPDMIEYTHLGLATNNVTTAMRYIRELYQQWEKQGYTHPDVQHKDAFNAQLQWQRLEQLLTSLTQHSAQ